MGNEAQTSTTEEFKALENEMNIRQEGIVLNVVASVVVVNANIHTRVGKDAAFNECLRSVCLSQDSRRGS